MCAHPYIGMTQLHHSSVVSTHEVEFQHTVVGVQVLGTYCIVHTLQQQTATTAEVVLQLLLDLNCIQ